MQHHGDIDGGGHAAQEEEGEGEALRATKERRKAGGTDGHRRHERHRVRKERHHSWASVGALLSRLPTQSPKNGMGLQLQDTGSQMLAKASTASCLSQQ